MIRPKYTPGPWHADFDGTCIEIRTDIEPDGDYISIATLTGDNKRDRANACMIAAVTDLYEALETQCEYCIGKEASDNPCDECIVGKALHKAGYEGGVSQ